VNYEIELNYDEFKHFRLQVYLETEMILEEDIGTMLTRAIKIYEVVFKLLEAMDEKVDVKEKRR